MYGGFGLIVRRIGKQPAADTDQANQRIGASGTALIDGCGHGMIDARQQCTRHRGTVMFPEALREFVQHDIDRPERP